MERAFQIESIDAFGRMVGTGRAGAQFVQIMGIGKRNSPKSPFAVVNEFICGRLALMIGLPVPPGTVFMTEDDEPVYVALQFGPKGAKPPPADVKALIEDYPYLVSGVAAFDAWIGNDDRHEENWVYARNAFPPLIFDHDCALLSRTHKLADSIISRTNEPWVPGDGMKQLRDGALFGEWHDRIRAVRPLLIRDICDEAANHDILADERVDAVCKYLIARQGRIADITRAGLPSVRWGLNL